MKVIYWIDKVAEVSPMVRQYYKSWILSWLMAPEATVELGPYRETEGNICSKFHTVKY